MADQERTTTKHPSHPELEARGWEDDEPTQVIAKTLAELTRTTSYAEAVCDASSSTVARSTQRLNVTLDRFDKTGT